METIYVGLLFIAFSALIKFFPGLLAGYNSLSHREKENAKTNGLPTFASIVLAVMGILCIGVYFVSDWSDLPSRMGINFVSISLAGAIILIIFGNRFTTNPN